MVCFADCGFLTTTPVSVGVPSLWVMTTNECSAGAEVVASVALNQQRKPPRLNGVYAEAWMSVPSVACYESIVSHTNRVSSVIVCSIFDMSVTF